MLRPPSSVILLFLRVPFDSVFRQGTPKPVVLVTWWYQIPIPQKPTGSRQNQDEWGLVNYSGMPQYEYEGSMGQIPGLLGHKAEIS